MKYESDTDILYVRHSKSNTDELWQFNNDVVHDLVRDWYTDYIAIEILESHAEFKCYIYQQPVYVAIDESVIEPDVDINHIPDVEHGTEQYINWQSVSIYHATTKPEH